MRDSELARLLRTERVMVKDVLPGDLIFTGYDAVVRVAKVDINGDDIGLLDEHDSGTTYGKKFHESLVTIIARDALKTHPDPSKRS